LPIIGEPVASGLALDESAMWDVNFTKAAAAVMSPPIRSKQHGAALKKALAGGLLQLVATDHAVFNSSQKAVGRGDFRVIPNGVNGLEERMHVVWQEMVVSGEGPHHLLCCNTLSGIERMTCGRRWWRFCFRLLWAGC
jgi:dihydropyrimidinase